MYDTKTINCSGCGKFIGEIDYDAIITLPKCGKCSNPLVREARIASVYVMNNSWSEK
jgi:phage FluMu protein Com